LQKFVKQHRLANIFCLWTIHWSFSM